MRAHRLFPGDRELYKLCPPAHGLQLCRKKGLSFGRDSDRPLGLQCPPKHLSTSSYYHRSHGSASERTTNCACADLKRFSCYSFPTPYSLAHPFTNLRNDYERSIAGFLIQFLPCDQLSAIVSRFEWRLSVLHRTMPLGRVFQKAFCFRIPIDTRRNKLPRGKEQKRRDHV